MLFSYAGPPLLGAFIGYLTNKVAIRMLFRPLKRWHFLGIPVPMTPGVIPAKRHELAKNIGEMVGTHLLTSKDIGSALSEEKFQDHLHSIVDDRINELLNMDLGPVQTLIPKRFQTYFKVAVRTLKYQFRSGVHRYLLSDEFESKVTETLLDQLESFGSRRVNEIVTWKERRAVYGFVDTLIEDLLSGPKTEEWLAGYLLQNLQQASEDGKKLNDFLPETLHDFIEESIVHYSPEMLQQLSKILSEPPVRERIIKAVRGGVDEFISSLGPIGSLAGSFLDMNVLEDSIRNYLVEKKDDIKSWLENPEVQQRFSKVLVEQVNRYLEKPLSELLAPLEEEKFSSLSKEIAKQVLGIVRSRGVIETMSTMLQENLEDLLGHGRQTVGELGQKMLSEKTAQNMKNMVATETVALVRSQRIRKLLDKMMNSMFDSVLDRPVGILNNILPKGVRAGFTEYAVQTINRIMLREVPSLVDSLEIRQIVTEKVDSLDLLRLERLLLSIMEEQFKYINLFGALLGFFIGLANLLLLHLQ
jgi:uncharacterized membrane protein YheB (UPF0754 family)